MKNDLYRHLEKKVAQLENDTKDLRERIKFNTGVTDEEIDEYLEEDRRRNELKKALKG